MWVPVLFFSALLLVKNKMKRTFYKLIGAILLTGSVLAQEIPLIEKSHDISRKSRKGYLGQITTNPENNTFDMVFFLKGGGKNTLKTETYSFDKDLNLIGNVKDEIQLEEARKKYKKLTYRGDELLFNMTTAAANMRGDLVLRKKEIRQFFDWWKGSYVTYADLKEKVKVKDEEGNKYAFFGGHYQNLITQKLLLVAGDKSKENYAMYGVKEFDVLSFDGDLKMTKTGTITFSNYKVPIFSNSLIDDMEADLPAEDFPRDWILVFAPVDGKGQEEKPTAYTYCRLSPDGGIKEKVDFTAPTNGWRLLKVIESNGVVTMIGSSIEKSIEKKRFNDVYPTGTVSKLTVNAKEQSLGSKGDNVANNLGLGAFTKFNAEAMLPTQEALDETLNELKYDHFAIGQIKDGKYTTLSYPGIEDFENVHMKPSDQKKYYDFDGKRFFIDATKRFSDGTIVVTGQDFDKEKVYKESYLFKFSPDGKLLANYGVNLDQRGKSNFFTKDSKLTPDKIPVINVTKESGDKNTIYWFMHKVKRVVSESETVGSYVYTSYYGKRSIQYAAINKQTNQIGEVKDLGDEEKRSFYLFDSNNTAEMNNYILYFSETLKGDKILISRFDTSK